MQLLEDQNKQSTTGVQWKDVGRGRNSAFEGVQEIEFASYYSLIIECNKEEARAEEKEKLAERKLRSAEKGSKAAGSDDLGESVERATCVKLFPKEVEFAQMQSTEYSAYLRTLI